MSENVAERNGARGVLFSERIEFSDADGGELFSADLVSLAMKLERLREQHGGKYVEYVEAVRQLVVAEYAVEQLTTSQAWCLIECVRCAWETFKKKFDAELILLTTTESTLSDLTTDRPTTTSPNCPDC